MDARIYAEMAALEQRHWWFAARRKILDKMISALPLPADAHILEAGCGTGGNLAMLARHGRVYGMETNAQALELAAAKVTAVSAQPNQTLDADCQPSVQIAAGRLPAPIPFDGQAFDLIVLLDVMEHLDDDTAALRALRSRLKPGGWLLITVPAYPFLWSHHDELHHHKRRYVARSLRAVIDAAGCRVQYLSYFNTWLFPLIAAVRLMRVGGRHGGDLTMPNKFANALLTQIFASERLLLGRVALPFGVSLLALARNPA